jgi:hypothetical protein
LANNLNFILQTLKVSLEESSILLGGFILGGLILGILERESNKNMQRALGRNGVMITALIGTPVHELGHAMMALLFGHKIVQFKLLQFESPDGTLGYVNHSYNKRNLYQRIGNFFIAIGPLFSGTFTILVSMFFLLPKTFNIILKNITKTKYIDFSIKEFMGYVLNSFQNVLKSIFTSANIESIGFWIFILIAICIASHIALSTQDMKGMLDGLVIFYIAIFIINLLAYVGGYGGLFGTIFSIKFINFYILYIISVSLIFSVITWIISIVLSLLIRS